MIDLNNYDEFMDFAADAFEPICKICADPAVAEALRNNIIGIPRLLLKNHRNETTEVLAALNGVTSAEYISSFSLMEIYKNLQELFNSPHFQQLFPSAEPKTGASASGTAQEVTQE